jgi:hypothetical protein
LSKTSLSWKVIPATELTEEVQQEQLIDDGMLERIGLGADGQPVYQWTDLFKRLKVRPDVPETKH